MRYLYIITTSNYINDKTTTLLYLSNSFAQQRRYKVVTINNNKAHSNKLSSIRVNETSTIKYMSKNVYYVNQTITRPEIFKLLLYFIINNAL